MAANMKAELNSISEVMSFYELHSEQICYVIYAGISMQHNLIAFDYLDKEQPEDARQKLQQFLELVQSREDNTNVYTIQLVDSWKEKETKQGTVKVFTGKSLRFQLNSPQPYNGINQSQNGQIIVKDKMVVNSDMVQLLKEMYEEQKKENEALKNKFELFLEQQNEKEEEEEEEEPQPLTTNERIMGMVGKLAERDEVQEAIAGLIVNGQKWLQHKVFKIDKNG